MAKSWDAAVVSKQCHEQTDREPCTRARSASTATNKRIAKRGDTTVVGKHGHEPADHEKRGSATQVRKLRRYAFDKR